MVAKEKRGRKEERRNIKQRREGGSEREREAEREKRSERNRKRERDREKEAGCVLRLHAQKSLKNSENKGEGACLLPRWPYYWRRQELLINAKKCGVGRQSTGRGDENPSEAPPDSDFCEFSSRL